VNWPGGGDSYAKNGVDCAWLKNRRKVLLIIEPMLLRKTVTNPRSFVPIKATTRVNL
jgi:hypothetical protein